MEDLAGAKAICEKMLEDGPARFEELEIESYMTAPETCQYGNPPIFRLDTVGFLYLWGSFLTWAVITVLCLAVGVVWYAKLPARIPVQWDGGDAVSFADRNCIFAYPLACVLLRVLLRPVLHKRLALRFPFGEMAGEYLTNYLCFIALSLELFTVLFLYGLAKSVTAVLAADTAVLLGMLALGLVRIYKG